MIFGRRQCAKITLKVFGFLAIVDLMLQSTTWFERHVGGSSTDVHQCGGTENCYKKHVSENPVKDRLDNDGTDTINTHINRKEEFRRSFPTNVFPPRSPREINATLHRVYHIMRPVVQQMENLRETILSTDDPWVPPSRPSLVIMSKYKGFQAKLARNTLEIMDKTKNASTPLKPQIRTVNILSNKAQLEDIFKPGFFLDYSSNNCTNIEIKTVYGRKMASRLFNATCDENVGKAWRPKSFQMHPFRIGQPEGYQPNATHVRVGYLHVIKNGAVDSVGDVASGNVKIVIQRCNMMKSRRVPHPNKNVYDEVLTISQYWGSGFYHATIEDFTRLGPYVPFLRLHKNIKIHVQSRTGFLKVFLEHLGISPDRLVTGSVGARVLYVPAGTACGRSGLFSTYALSLEFRNKMTTPVEPRKSIVIIKRTVKRRFTHHKEIHKMLQRVVDEMPWLHLKVEVYPDNPVPGIGETLAIMSRAFIVIGPHGAGESNLLFSEAGTVMVEGLCKSGSNRAILCYRNLAQVLGQRYYGILSKNSCYTARKETIEEPLRQVIQYYFT